MTPPALFFFKVVLAVPATLNFHANFSLKDSVSKSVEILIRIVLNLCASLENCHFNSSKSYSPYIADVFPFI